MPQSSKAYHSRGFRSARTLERVKAPLELGDAHHQLGNALRAREATNLARDMLLDRGHQAVGQRFS